MATDRRWLIVGATSTAGAYFVHFLQENTDDLIVAASRQDPNDRPWEYPFIFKDKNKSQSDRLYYEKYDLNFSVEEQFRLIKKYTPTHIVNFACLAMVGQSWANPEDWYKTNIIGQSRFMMALSQYDKVDLYLHFSTPEVYGNMIDYGIESSDFNPSTPYAASRASGDLISKMWANEYEIPMITTRASSIYCEGQHLYRIIPRSMLCALNELPLKIDGSGDVKRQYVHMEDVSDAIIKIVDRFKISPNKRYDEYHIGSEKLISITEIIKLAASVAGKLVNELPITYGKPRKGSDKQYLLNSEKLHMIGWEEKINIEVGMRRVGDWIKSLPKESIDYINYIHRP